MLRPRIRIPLSAAERVVLSTWRKRVLAFYALLAAAFTGYLALTPGTSTIAQDTSRDERAETCVQYTGALLDAADRKMPGQVANHHMMRICASADDPARAGGAPVPKP